MLLSWGCGDPPPPPPSDPPPVAEALAEACEACGTPRVDRVAEGVFVARGFDLANTIALATDHGVVIVDPGMTVPRATAAREALARVVSGPVHAVIYTHGHIDHVGGAAAWLEEGTQIWATDRLSERFYARYGTLLPAEAARAARQFGRDLDPAARSCAAIGPHPDLDVSGAPIGARMPTDTFSGRHTLSIDGLTLQLVEAHGETPDQLFVWLPDREVLLCGDNWYRAFPNLYTIRGTSPRPVDDWIASLDAMRRLDPAVLVPSHTAAVSGRPEVRAALRTYRDGIQYVRDAVVRGANDGQRVDVLAATVRLPPHLANDPALAEIYGQVDWSVRGLYDGALGWFDGRASGLYPLPPEALAARTVEAMGGAQAVLARAREARTEAPRWSAHLLGLLEDEGVVDAAVLAEEIALTYEAIAATVDNANGRAYLLQSARERREGPAPARDPDLPDAFVDRMPLEMLFAVMATRLQPDRALQIHESVAFDIREGDRVRTFTVTVRRGVAEVVEGDPLPETPEPIARVATDAATWRRVAVRKIRPLGALASGALSVEGNPIALKRFLDRFASGLAAPPTVPP